MNVFFIISAIVVGWIIISIPIGLFVGKCIAAGNMKHCFSEDEYYEDCQISKQIYNSNSKGVQYGLI